MPSNKSTSYEALFELSQSISGQHDLDGLCHALSKSLKKVIDFDHLGMFLFNTASGTLDIFGLNIPDATSDTDGHHLIPGDDDPVGSVWIHQRPFLIPDINAESGWPELINPARAAGIFSILLVPLTTGEVRLGVLAFGFLRPFEANQDEMDFIHRVASEFAVTIELHLTRRQYIRERDRLKLLFDLTNALVSKLSPDTLLSAVSDELRRVVSFDVLALTILDKKTGDLLLSGLRKEDNSGWEFDWTRVPSDGTPAAEALSTGRPVILEGADTKRFSSPVYRSIVEAGFRYSCSIPLISPNATLGTLELGRTSGNRFNDEDLELLVQLARQIAIAMENSLAYRELAEMKERLTREKSYLEDEIRFDLDFGEMLGDSPAFRAVLKNIQIVAPTEATVLIIGETGTGKELAARAIHERSERSNHSFIKVNCAAIPSSLLESELFGHEKGAFTGALTQRVGRFELAHRGTLFLDEIGEIPLELQSKLLRAIQEQEFERLGGNRTVKVDARIIAASNRDLKAMVNAGSFRSDLYYRLHVFPIMLPPLRERREDIPLLARYFTQKYAKKLGRGIESIPTGAMNTLVHYTWPGNIRELQNVIERSVILSHSRILELAVPEIESKGASELPPDAAKAVERDRILQALKESDGLISGPNGAAKRLGLKRTTLQWHMKKLGITRDYR